MASKIFKITTPDRKLKSLAIGSDITELITDACENLEIRFNSSCELVLEEECSRIQKFNHLEKLVSFYPDAPLLLMLLHDGKKWEPAVMEKVSRSNIASEFIDITSDQFEKKSTLSTTNSRSNSTDSHSSSISQEELNNLALPWDQIVPYGMENAAAQPVSYELEMIRRLADHQKHILKDTSFSTSKRLAQLAVEKYPLVFGYQTWINESGCCTGIPQLQVRIYDRVRKMTSAQKRKSDFCSDAETPAKRALNIERYGKNQDSYGCVAFEPALPEGETKETQLSKKKSLLDSLLQPETKLPVAEETILLAETYPSQRACINNRELHHFTLSSILNDHWPHLKIEKHFLEHSCTLLGKDVLKIWRDNLDKKTPAIYDYFRNYNLKYKQKKNIPEVANKIKTTLELIKTESEKLRSHLPKTLGFITHLPTFFNEANLFSLIDTNATDEEVANAEDSTRPILVIKGMSLYEENASCAIVTENTILLKTNSVLEGVLFLILSHYVYGYNYAANKSSTMEFMQRMLLEINPDHGHRRGRKNKYKKIEQDTKVMSLMSAIINFATL